MKTIDDFHGDYFFLSNFYEEKNGYTNEHHFQAAKTDDLKEKLWVYSAPDPGKAKKRGRNVTLRAGWRGNIDLIEMRATCLRKFLDYDLAEKLIATGDVPLVEGNWWGDDYWGCVQYEGQWKGANHLGKILMEIRTELAILL